MNDFEKVKLKIIKLVFTFYSIGKGYYIEKAVNIYTILISSSFEILIAFFKMLFLNLEKR